jgi:hypothetical protein
MIRSSGFGSCNHIYADGINTRYVRSQEECGLNADMAFGAGFDPRQKSVRSEFEAEDDVDDSALERPFRAELAKIFGDELSESLGSPNELITIGPAP